jgi:hypothetical protein
VRHLKNSYGPQRPPAFFANRSGYLRPLSEKTAAEKKTDRMRSEIECKNTLLERMNEIGYVVRRDIERTAQFAKDLGLTRDSLRIAVRDALEGGQLTMVDARKNGKGQSVSILISKAGADALARDGYILDA